MSLIEGDMVVDGTNGGAEVNQAPKEYSSWAHKSNDWEQWLLRTGMLALEFKHAAVGLFLLSFHMLYLPTLSQCREGHQGT